MSQGRIPVRQWGRDHWSLLLYLETVAVDHGGVIGWGAGQGFIRLRCDPGTHPLLCGPRLTAPASCQPTRLANDERIEAYDDWDCFDDLEAAGFVANVGTGTNPVVQFTDRGWTKVGELRRARAERALATRSAEDGT
jgi:hypothetical protein